MPYGTSEVVEFEQRMAHWEQGEWTQLLNRIRLQSEAKQRDVQRLSTSDAASAAGRKARRLAQGGARSKAVQRLRGGIKAMTPDEEERWGRTLLPWAQRALPSFNSADSAMQGEASTPDASRLPADENPMKGIKFPPLASPGPSNCRDEHIRDLLSVKKRSVSGRLLRLLGRFIDVALAGNLPSAARWILGSSVTFLEKKDSDTPRPIRVCEWLRKIVGKAGLRRHSKEIMKLMIRVCQFGVAMPGGAEALYHARDCIEELAASGSMGPIAIIDVDLVNCFPSIEWEAIVEAYSAELPGMEPWERWCTQQATQATLPSGGQTPIDRGAGQGEPDGPLKTSVTLGRAVEREKNRDQSPLASECVDMWFLDDGQIITRPWKIDSILRRLDDTLQQIGATRGSKATHGTVKSMVRVFCGPDDTLSPDWLTDYVQESCNIVDVAEPVKVLGGVRGSQEHIVDDFLRTCKKVRDLHSAIDYVDDAATEIVLKKECADVSKINYTLRLCGDQIPNERLEEYTAVMRESVTISRWRLT